MEELKLELQELETRLEDLESCENVEEYDEMLDSEGLIKVCGYEYYPSKILSEVDPIAYRCGHNDYNDSLISEVNEEIEDKKQEIKDY